MSKNLNYPVVEIKCPPLLSKSIRMASHILIQINPIQQEQIAQITCALCIIKKADGQPVVPGTIRCVAHSLRCATCNSYVENDTHLCCFTCWRNSSIPIIPYNKGTCFQKKPVFSEKMLPYRLHPQKYQCSCHLCSKSTFSFLELRAMEEGEAHSLSPPRSNGTPESFVLDINR